MSLYKQAQVSLAFVFFPNTTCLPKVRTACSCDRQPPWSPCSSQKTQRPRYALPGNQQHFFSDQVKPCTLLLSLCHTPALDSLVFIIGWFSALQSSNTLGVVPTPIHNGPWEGSIGSNGLAGTFQHPTPSAESRVTAPPGSVLRGVDAELSTTQPKHP